MIYRSIRPLSTPCRLSKHAIRIQLGNTSPSLSWSRSFHASASLQVVDLAYKLHDNNGKAKGDPIVIIHGLFGSKRNNQSVSKYVLYLLRTDVATNTAPVSSRASSPDLSTQSTHGITANHPTTRLTIISPSQMMLKPFSKSTT